MSLIQVKLIENELTPSQKEEIINRLTDAMANIEGENMRQTAWVSIEDVPGDEWGIDGMDLTTEEVHNLMAGRNPKDIECCLDLDTIPFPD